MTKSVAIIYGWAEGPRHGVRMRKELRKAGFSITRRPSKADIIIAHSGGGLLLPKRPKAELVLLVGLPYWPGKHPLLGLKDKLRLEFKNSPGLIRWLKKTFYNGVYSIKPRHHYRIRRNWKRQRYPSDKSRSFVAVRNQHDSFTHPEEIVKLAEERSWGMVSVPGDHDDCWLHPDKYVGIIQSYIKLK